MSCSRLAHAWKAGHWHLEKAGRPKDSTPVFFTAARCGSGNREVSPKGLRTRAKGTGCRWATRGGAKGKPRDTSREYPTFRRRPTLKGGQSRADLLCMLTIDLLKQVLLGSFLAESLQGGLAYCCECCWKARWCEERVCCREIA